MLVGDLAGDGEAETGAASGAVLIVSADDEGEVRAKMKQDPRYVNGILTLEHIKRWDIFIDRRS